MWKMIPYYMYQIDAIESWLDEQARGGLFVKEKGLLGLRFEKGAPDGARRYRIDLKRTGGTYGEEKRIESYREMGWEYVCELSSRADIYYCDDPDAPELNTDEGTLHEVLDALLTREIRWGIVGLVLVPALWVWNILPFNGGYAGIYDYLESGGLIVLSLLTVTILLFVASVGVKVLDAAGTRKRLLLTRDYHTATRASRRRKWSRVYGVAAILAFVLWVVACVHINRDHTIPVDEFTGPDVTELFPGHEAPSTYMWSDTLREDATCEKILPSTVQRLRQEGTEIIDLETHETEHIWTYQLAIHEFWFSGWGESYAEEQAAKWGYTAVTVDGWDSAWYGETRYEGEDGSNRQYYQDLCLVRGDTVWDFYYWGDTGYDLLAAAQDFDFSGYLS